MRIILALIASVIISFLITESLVKLRRLVFKGYGVTARGWPLHYSKLGLLALVAGIITLILNPFHNLDSAIGVYLSTILIGSGIGIILHHLLSQNFILSKRFEYQLVKHHETKIERFLEILPGGLTWLALTLPIWLSFFLPFAVAYLIILADIYWLITACRISILVLIGYRRTKAAMQVNWQQRLKADFPDQWAKYYHLIVLPTYNESIEVLRPAFEAVVQSSYDPKKIFLAVGFEARMQEKDPEKIRQNIQVAQGYSPQIGAVFTTIHPFGLPGEIPGPGTNRNWMIDNAVQELRKRGISTDQVIVTTLDADFVIHHQFLAGALHKYLSTPDSIRDQRSFTGVFLYNNNYWQAPTPMRIIASGTAFWQLSEMVGSDKYINFSSLSMNLKSLLQIGGWIPNKINDDSGFFWKAYYHYKGDYKVIPHYLPISADTVLDVTLWKTVQNQYLQLKRWAYGVEHLPFIITQYFKNPEISFWNRTDRLTFILWAYFKWGTLALFITLGGFFIPLVNPSFSQSVVYYNLGTVSSWILTLAYIGSVVTIYVNEKLVPPRPKNWGFITRTWSYIQWAVVPIMLVSMTSIPAIDAQTSLMLGRYLEFRTTNKARPPQSIRTNSGQR